MITTALQRSAIVIALVLVAPACAGLASAPSGSRGGQPVMMYDIVETTNAGPTEAVMLAELIDNRNGATEWMWVDYCASRYCEGARLNAAILFRRAALVVASVGGLEAATSRLGADGVLSERDRAFLQFADRALSDLADTTGRFLERRAELDAETVRQLEAAQMRSTSLRHAVALKLRSGSMRVALQEGCVRRAECSP